MKAFWLLSITCLAVWVATLSHAADNLLIYSERGDLLQDAAQAASSWRATASPLSGTSWSTGIPRIEAGLGAAFSQRFSMAYQRPVTDGVTLFTSTALGLDPQGYVLGQTGNAREPEPYSLFISTTGVEIALGSHASLRFTTGVRREASASRFDEQPHLDAGVTLTLMPAAETWVAVGAFQRWSVEDMQGTGVLTAMLGTRLWDLPVNLDVSSWMVVGGLTGGSSDYQALSADASLSWQVTPTLWTAVGIARNAEDSAGYAWADWSIYARWALRVSQSVSYGLQVCQARFTGQAGQGASATQDETRLRVSRNYRVSDSFSTEVSAEYAIGGGNRPEGAPPAFCLIGQVTF